MQLSLLSRFRKQLMGLAILWIMTYHSLYAIPDGFPFSILHFVHRTGYGGVEVFFLLSGMGLAFGWARRPLSPPAFWKRRLLRLLPTFWIGTLAWMLTRPLRGLDDMPSPRTVIEAFSGLGLWIGGEGPFWFLSAIAACYLAFPFLAKYCWQENRLRRPQWAWMLGIGALGTAALAASPLGDSVLIATMRMPLFLLGMGIGFRLNEEGPELRVHTWILGLAGVVGIISQWLVFWNLDRDMAQKWGIWWLPFWLSTLPVCLFAANLLGRLRGRIANILLAPLSWAGERSLELYVCHIVLFSSLPNSDDEPRWFFVSLSEPARIPEYLTYFALAALAAEALGRLQTKIFSR